MWKTNNSINDSKQRKESLHYFAVKDLPTLLRWITSKHQSYCLNWLHSFRTRNKLKSHQKVCKKRFLWNCNAIRTNNILEFNQYMMSDKMLYIVYADMESLIKNIDGCSNNPENKWTTQ